MFHHFTWCCMYTVWALVIFIVVSSSIRHHYFVSFILHLKIPYDWHICYKICSHLTDKSRTCNEISTTCTHPSDTVVLSNSSIRNKKERLLLMIYFFGEQCGLILQCVIHCTINLEITHSISNSFRISWFQLFTV